MKKLNRSVISIPAQSSLATKLPVHNIFLLANVFLGNQIKYITHKRLACPIPPIKLTPYENEWLIWHSATVYFSNILDYGNLLKFRQRTKSSNKLKAEKSKVSNPQKIINTYKFITSNSANPFECDTIIFIWFEECFYDNSVFFFVGFLEIGFICLVFIRIDIITLKPLTKNFSPNIEMPRLCCSLFVRLRVNKITSMFMRFLRRCVSALSLESLR